MRVVITGGTGNVGTALVRRLEADEKIESIAGIARRAPDWHPAKTEWHVADVGTDDLVPIFEGADAVVHLAWAIQPSRDAELLERTNVTGSNRVFDAAARAGVGALIHASSIGAYSPGPQDRAVDESWPREGIPTSFYSRHKVAAERALDRVQAENPQLRTVRLRPTLIFQAEAATEIRRYFAGPFLPNPLVRAGLIPVVPHIEGMRFQAVHSDDVAEAYRLALHNPDAKGAFNIAADPVLSTESLAEIFEARAVRTPVKALRAAADLSWRLRLQPTPAGWVDMGVEVPVMDTTRAREVLGWSAAKRGDEALREVLAGLREGRTGPTPPLSRAAGGPARLREVAQGVGARV